MGEKTMSVDRLENIISVFGSFDENLRLIEDELSVRITDRNSELNISGSEENVFYAERAINGLLVLAAKGETIDSRSVRYIIGLVKDGQENKIGEITKDIICISAKGKPIKAKTLGQKKYIDAIQKNDITFSIGPAGTGKTFLAVALAVTAFRTKT